MARDTIDRSGSGVIKRSRNPCSRIVAGGALALKVVRGLNPFMAIRTIRRPGSGVVEVGWPPGIDIVAGGALALIMIQRRGL
jgi:hypothetical protein